jgi:hypothetical protein
MKKRILVSLRIRNFGSAVIAATVLLVGMWLLMMRTPTAQASPAADSMTFTPSNPKAGEMFTVTVSSGNGYVWVDLGSVPATTITWVGTAGHGPYYWQWNAVASASGTYTFTFYYNCVPGPCITGVQNTTNVQAAASMTFTPSDPALNQTFSIRVMSPNGYAWVELGVDRWQDTQHCPFGSDCHAWSSSGREGPDYVSGSYTWHWGARVTVPGTYTFTFYYNCPPGPGCTSAVQESLTARQVFGVSLSPNRTGSAYPGTLVTYTHTLVNTGNYTDTLALTKSSSQGWTVDVSPANVSLPTGGSRSVIVSVTVPAGAVSGTMDTTIITATSQLSAMSRASVVGSTTVKQVLGVALSPNRSGTTGPGTVITYTHTLTNTSNGSDAFTLQGTSSQGWTVDVSLASVSLPAGGSRSVVVSVTVPANAISSTVDTAIITATSQSDAAVQASAADITTVGLDGIIDLSPGQAATPHPGETVIYTHTLNNAVNYTQTFTLQAVSAAGFTATVTDSTAPPFAQTIITVSVQTSPTASGGLTDTVTVTAAGSLLGQVVVTDVLTVRTSAIYLPLVIRNWPPTHDLTDAPDVCNTGQGVELGHYYRDDFDHANDNDWYRFQAVSGVLYTVQTSDLGSRADTVLALFAADCATRLAENDDLAPGNPASRIVFTTPANATYCVNVRSYDWRVYGADTGYTLGVSTGGAVGSSATSTASDKPVALPTPTPRGDRNGSR